MLISNKQMFIIGSLLYNVTTMYNKMAVLPIRITLYHFTPTFQVQLLNIPFIISMTVCCSGTQSFDFCHVCTADLSIEYIHAKWLSSCVPWGPEYHYRCSASFCILSALSCFRLLWTELNEKEFKVTTL